MEKDICKCTCHQNPLLFHFNNCCENKGKIYLNENGEVNFEKYNLLKPKEKTSCPCCGGSGKIESKD